MKKGFLAFMVFMAVLCTVSPAFAKIISNETTGTPCGANLMWKYDTDTKTLTISGTGAMSDFDWQAGGMRAPWVKGDIQDNLECVVISDGVTSIGEYAFFECTSLKSVTIPGTVKTINEGAFYKCTGLTSPEAAKTDEEIADEEIANEEIADSITIPYGVESIGKDAFQHCTGLRKVTIPGSVKSIGDGAFSYCYYEERDDDNNITFSCGLEKVVIENGTKSIDAFAFDGCKKLNDIYLPDSVTSIGENAFQYTGIYYDWWDGGDDVLYINNHLITAYYGKSTPCNVKSGTKTIADKAFAGCNSITDITIPNSVTSIGYEAFFTCFNLKNINVAEDNPAYCSENGVLYNKEKTEIVRLPRNNETYTVVFTVPTSVTGIADGAFEFCNRIIIVMIPDSVKSIGDSAFEECTNLISITIPDSVASVGDKAFYKCAKLKSVIIPDGVPRIGDSAFEGCSKLTSVTIPNSVISIGKQAFLNCSLENVYYFGSDADWTNIEKGTKYSISDDIITCLSGISAKPSADGKSIVVKPINIADGKTVILALYDGNKFVGIQQSNEYSDDNREITFTPTETYTRAKVMIWNSFGGMSPVCDFKIIE